MLVVKKIILHVIIITNKIQQERRKAIAKTEQVFYNINY